MEQVRASRHAIVAEEAHVDQEPVRHEDEALEEIHAGSDPYMGEEPRASAEDIEEDDEAAQIIAGPKNKRQMQAEDSDGLEEVPSEPVQVLGQDDVDNTEHPSAMGEQEQSSPVPVARRKLGLPADGPLKVVRLGESGRYHHSSRPGASGGMPSGMGDDRGGGFRRSGVTDASPVGSKGKPVKVRLKKHNRNSTSNKSLEQINLTSPNLPSQKMSGLTQEGLAAIKRIASR